MYGLHMNYCRFSNRRKINVIDYAYTKGKTKLSLSPLASGGEGTVYEIMGHPNRAAKLYHNESPDQRSKREAKIDAMVAISQSFVFRRANLLNDIAWPLAPLYDKFGNFIGFGMNRIAAAAELDDLYAYPSKPNSAVTIKNRVTCLISLCDVIDRLHQTGQVFGDFNPNNIKIKPDWSVSFVDADSYHVRNSGREYRCVVCAPGYVAPELIRACKGTTYADCPGSTFTRETDRFALAIHIFRMLMNGCHPYICERHLKRTGSAPAPKSTDRRVESGETPFFKSIPNYVAPQYAPDINTLPPYLYDLFRKAFVDGHVNPAMRPSASEWKRALIRYSSELTACRSNHSHYYWKGNSSCPYCASDRRYHQKMGLVPAKSRTAAVNAGNNSNTHTIRQTKPAAASAAPVAPPRTNPAYDGWFWVLTLAAAAVMLLFLGMYVLPDIYAKVFENETLTAVGIVGSMISGIVGSVLFNSKWSPGSVSGVHAWWEYLLSVLTAFGFTLGFGLAMWLLILVLYLLFNLLAAAFVIALIIGAISGG